MSKYMHTIDGKPAVYVDGQQICYALSGRYTIGQLLVPDLATIRRQQEASRLWRVSQGYDETEYDYLRFGE